MGNFVLFPFQRARFSCQQLHFYVVTGSSKAYEKCESYLQSFLQYKLPPPSSLCFRLCEALIPSYLSFATLSSEEKKNIFQR